MGRLRWPLPAVLAWGAAWALHAVMVRSGFSPAWAAAVPSLLGVAMSLWGHSWWRRVLIAAGFPVALAITGTAALPAWIWLVLVGLLALIYPLNAWRDAPLFPTPHRALDGLAGSVPLAHGARVLDAGCGLGHGLMALRGAYPQAQLEGVEWSWPLRAVCGLRCPWARVFRGDMWRVDWRPYALVYLFQRPESMPRAVAKAIAELPSGSWLVSLEFEAATLRPTATLALPDGRLLWLYRMPAAPRSETS